MVDFLPLHKLVANSPCRASIDNAPFSYDGEDNCQVLRTYDSKSEFTLGQLLLGRYLIAPGQIIYHHSLENILLVWGYEDPKPTGTRARG